MRELIEEDGDREGIPDDERYRRTTRRYELIDAILGFTATTRE
jgi:hypothetical protein